MAEAKRDYYEILGVSRDADDATLKKAYRALAKKYQTNGVSTISLVMRRLKAVQAEPVDMAVLILTGQTLVIFLVISSVICLAVAEEADVRTMVR